MIHEILYEIHEEEEKKGDKLSEKIQGSALFIFTKDNCYGLRAFVLKLVNNGKFDNIILALIGVSTLNLAIETPFDVETGMKAKVL